MFYRVRSAYPDEKGYVDKRQKELQDIWDALKVNTVKFAYAVTSIQQSPVFKGHLFLVL
jgi:hypothetical protein